MAWEMARELGYNPITTFWDDFTIAENFNAKAVEQTAKKAFDEWKDNYKYLTELIMVINHKCWEHYHRGNSKLSALYSDLRKPSRMVLRPKPPNHSTRATLSSPGRTPSPLSLRSTRASTVLTRSTRSTSMSSRTRRCQVLATTASPPAPMVPQSEPRFRPSPLSVHRHGKPLLDLLHAIDHCH